MAKALSAGTRKPHSGSTRSLVIAIDVGTTFSGVSYAILEPGEIPKIHGVTRFPGQEHVAGNTKIPSVIYYDKHGKVMAAGAEADSASVISQSEDEGWIKVELFKLRLRPRTMQLSMNGMRFSPLPRRKTAVQVFGDFLSYLFQCTKMFIIDTHANGAALWNAVEDNLQFVLSHPNGWEGPQQSKMRRAAIHGGLIPDSNAGKARIWFVTEGEASLHACVLSGLANEVLSSPSQHGFLIADAGGGTLDISSYAIRSTDPLVIEEIAPPDCIFAGSVFVSRRARGFLVEKLKNSKYGTSDSLDHITRKFDETTKRLFRDQKELQFIHFGSPLDKDPSVGIRSGQLKLTGVEVANLFEPSVDAAVRAIRAQIDASRGMIRSVFLVGGYAASPWLFSQLQERLAQDQVIVSRPDSQTSKAVADGAIGFFCDHHVSARMSKFLYGVEYLRDFDPNNHDHVARRDRLCELPSGPKLLPDAFDCILARGVKVKESTVFTRKYSTELTSLSLLSVFEVEVWCYRGGNEIPLWIDRHSDAFSTLCIVQADLSVLSGSAEDKVGKSGKQYWTIVFSVEIHFGLTEFKARIKWVDSGNTKYGPATIIYNEHGHRALDEDEPDTYPEDDHGGSTPRSERVRSLPASGSRTPTSPHYPSSPGGYDGNSMYTGDGSSIRGIPPPVISPHEFVTERVSSKPVTQKATSPIPPQMERDLSTDSRRTSTTTVKGKASAARGSRASSAAGAKIGDTLSAVWDPHLRSPINPQPPTPQAPPTQPHVQPPMQSPPMQSPMQPLMQSPMQQPMQSPMPPPVQSPVQPPMQSPMQPPVQSPTQPLTQPATQPTTPKSTKSKGRSRKASANATAYTSPQPLSQLQPDVVGQSHEASPRLSQTPAQVPAIVAPSPKPTALPSPKPPSRALFQVASPTQQSVRRLSAHIPPLQSQCEPEFEFSGASNAETFAMEDPGYAGEVPITSGGTFDQDGGGDQGWVYGDDTGGFGHSTGDGAEDWGLGANNDVALEANPPTGVSGLFTGDGMDFSGSGNASPPPDGAAEGAAKLLSGSISSLLSSDTVNGIGNRLSSTFGIGSSKNQDTSGQQNRPSSILSFSSSKGQEAAGQQPKSGTGFSSFRAMASSGFGFGSNDTGGGAGSGSIGWDAAGGSTGGALSGSKGWAPGAWGKSNAGSKVTTPNPGASPKVQEQMHTMTMSVASSKIATPNPQASPIPVVQTVTLPDDEQQHDANEYSEEMQHEAGQNEMNAPMDPIEVTAKTQLDEEATGEASPTPPGATAAGEEEWEMPATGKKGKKGKNQKPGVSDTEKKKGKKSAADDQETYKKQGPFGLLGSQDAGGEENQQDAPGGAAGGDDLETTLDDLLGDEVEDKEPVEDEDTQPEGGKNKKGKGGGGGGAGAGAGKAKKKKKK